MNIDRSYFEAILIELIEENPLACQGILSISEIIFTTDVPTLAVTLRDDPPRLLVNLEFVRAHCTKEVHLKTLLLHEFLHVLLNHTGEYDVAEPAVNVALDAVICEIVGLKRERMPTTLAAEEMGAGQTRLEEISIAGDDIGNFQVGIGFAAPIRQGIWIAVSEKFLTEAARCNIF